MAQDNKEGSIKNIGSAALEGASNAINNKIIEPIEKATRTGDMNITNSPHPVDAVGEKLHNIKQYVATPSRGDMNLENAPHPVDSAVASANETIGKIKNAGPVEGTKLAAELAIGAVIDGANPGKKVGTALDAVDKIADETAVVKKVTGEHIPAGSQELVNTAGHSDLAVSQEKTGLARFTDKAKEMVGKVPVLGDVVNPDFETRVAIETHKLRPTTDEILRAKQFGSPGDIDQAQAAIKESAEKLKQLAKDNPELANEANRHLTNQQIRDGIVNSVDKNRLTHGGSSSGDYTPDVPPPTHKDFLPMSANDAAHLVFTPQNASEERMARVKQLMDAEYATHASKVQMAGVPYAWGAVVTTSVGAVKLATHDWRSDEEKNTALADSFVKAASREMANPAGTSMKDLVRDYGELKNAAGHYQEIESQHSKQANGQLNDQDKTAMQLVANNIAKQIREKGPESFGEVSQQKEVTH